MTWGASAARSLNLLVVLPLVVSRLDAPEIAVWYLFVTLIQLQLLADLGFSPTFVRVFAYAAGGADVMELAEARGGSGGTRPVNWRTVERIWGTVHSIYGRLTALAVAGMAIVGTAFVWRPIGAIADPQHGWIAWMTILGASTIILRGNAYAAYLNGLDHVALVRRWEAVMSLLASVTQAGVLLVGGGLISLTVSHQVWMVLNVVRNRYLARWIESGRLRDFATALDKRVFSVVWPRAWRSGLGLAMGNLPLQLTGMYYAQVADAERAAEYLVSLNLFGAIRGFSMAPLYSRLPTMARLRAEGRLDALARVARRGMHVSFWVFALLTVGMGVFAGRLLGMVGANATTVAPLPWALLGVALFVERYGASHLQLYSTTNHILWHIANGIAGSIVLLACAALFPALGLLAFPAAFLCGYLGFYVPFVVPRSLRAIDSTFMAFDVPILAGPTVVMAALLALALLVG